MARSRCWRGNRRGKSGLTSGFAGFEAAGWRPRYAGLYCWALGRLQMARPIVVNATWDAQAKVWIAESEGVPGLATGADTLEELVEKLKVAIPELLAENGIPFEADNLPFKIEAERSERSEYANVAA